MPLFHHPLVALNPRQAAHLVGPIFNQPFEKSHGLESCMVGLAFYLSSFHVDESSKACLDSTEQGWLDSEGGWAAWNYLHALGRWPPAHTREWSCQGPKPGQRVESRISNHWALSLYSQWSGYWYGCLNVTKKKRKLWIFEAGFCSQFTISFIMTWELFFNKTWVLRTRETHSNQ